jgi:hypothetical protein
MKGIPPGLHHRRGVVRAPVVELVDGQYGTLVQLEGRPHPVMVSPDGLEDIVEQRAGKISGSAVASAGKVILLLLLVVVFAGSYYCTGDSGNAYCTSAMAYAANLSDTVTGMINSTDTAGIMSHVSTAWASILAQAQAIHLPPHAAPLGTAFAVLFALYVLDIFVLNYAVISLVLALGLIYATGTAPQEWGGVKSFVMKTGLECDLLTRRDLGHLARYLPDSPPLLSIVTTTSHSGSLGAAMAAMTSCKNQTATEAMKLPIVAFGVLDKWLFWVKIPDSGSDIVGWLLSVVSEADQQMNWLGGGSLAVLIVGGGLNRGRNH